MRPLLLLLVVVSAFGCTHTRAVHWVETPKSEPAQKRTGSVAVLFSPGMRSHVESARPAGLLGLFRKYRFPVGEQLCDVLFTSVRNTYERALRVDSQPPPGRHDRIIRFSIEDSDLEIAFREAYLAAGDGRLKDRYEDARYTIIVNVEVEDAGAEAAIRKGTLKAAGYSSEEFSLSILAALHELTEEVEAFLGSQPN